MARLIKETPILYGEDARRFEKRMSEKRPETPEARERRLRNYAEFMDMLSRGEQLKSAKRA